MRSEVHILTSYGVHHTPGTGPGYDMIKCIIVGIGADDDYAIINSTSAAI